jgi:hypothetical protein
MQGREAVERFERSLAAIRFGYRIQKTDGTLRVDGTTPLGRSAYKKPRLK